MGGEAMAKRILLAAWFAAGTAVGYFLGLRATWPVTLHGMLQGLPVDTERLRDRFPPLAVTAQGTVLPATGAISLDALFHSMDPAEALTADIHVGGTLHEPTWEVRSLKKKNVRLRIRL